MELSQPNARIAALSATTPARAAASGVVGVVPRAVVVVGVRGTMRVGGVVAVAASAVGVVTCRGSSGWGV